MNNITFATFAYGPDRYKNLEITMNAANTYKLNNMELILFEQNGTNYKELAKKYNFKYYNELKDIKSPAYWRNRTIEKCSNEIIIINDSDIIPHKTLFETINNEINNMRYIGNYTDVINLSDELTKQIYYNKIQDFGYSLDNSILQNLKHRHYINTGSNGGSNTIRKSDFNAINGYDESYINMGKEDNDFIVRLIRYINMTYGNDKYKILSNFILHSYHTRTLPRSEENNIRYNKLLKE